MRKPVGHVSHGADELTFSAEPHFSHEQLDGKAGAVLPPRLENASRCPDNLARSRPQIVVEIEVVGRAMRFRHEHRDVFPDDVLRRVAKGPLCRRVERRNCPTLVDRDDHLAHIVDDALEPCVLLNELVFPVLSLVSLAEVGHPDPAQDIEEDDGGAAEQGREDLAPP